jgi:hypothetical protein
MCINDADFFGNLSRNPVFAIMSHTAFISSIMEQTSSYRAAPFQSFSAPPLQPLQIQWSILSLTIHQVLFFVSGLIMVLFPGPAYFWLFRSLFFCTAKVDCMMEGSHIVESWGENLLLLTILLQPIKLTTDAFLRLAAHRVLALFWILATMNRIMSWPFNDFSFGNLFARVPICVLLASLAALPLFMSTFEAEAPTEEPLTQLKQHLKSFKNAAVQSPNVGVGAG